MDLYIGQERFGEFVENVINQEAERRKVAAQKEDDQKLWMMYVHSEASRKISFNEWKEIVMSPGHRSSVSCADEDLTDEDIKGILVSLFPGKIETGGDG